MSSPLLYYLSSENYGYFKAEDDRWKNSVRHNLSMNPHFRKGGKSKHGAGHLWVMADYEEEEDEEGGDEEGDKGEKDGAVDEPSAGRFRIGIKLESVCSLESI